MAENAEISELERDFGLAAVDFVGHGDWNIQNNLEQTPL
jgi:hypothetical protein